MQFYDIYLCWRIAAQWNDFCRRYFFWVFFDLKIWMMNSNTQLSKWHVMQCLILSLLMTCSNQKTKPFGNFLCIEVTSKQKMKCFFISSMNGNTWSWLERNIGISSLKKHQDIMCIFSFSSSFWVVSQWLS